MTLFRLVTGLYFFAVLLVTFCTASRVVNITDAWLLSDSESPVFYRHFRDRVTWSEAEAICQFHHSVLATVRNTGEFDRTRALLQELAWTTPVWVGLRRVLGQPITPPGATLLPADGYWHETPGPMGGTRALCVTVDPAADFRWRAVDCASSAELFSFLCQIPGILL
ncbi:hypothetical protein B566_EDAN016804 [Ephemera danica]|nr:hypothetical protein B566_EDAN016804 [Ephemera danica]